MQTVEPFLDIFAVVIFLGVVQGIFQCFFFLTRGDAFTVSNRFLGLLLLSLAAIIFEMFLGYSGYMTKVIHLVDFSEPINLTVGPLLFLAVKTRIEQSERVTWRHAIHLVPFVLYTLYHLDFLLQNANYKYGAWLEAWRPDVTPTVLDPTINPDPLHLRAYVTELTVGHILFYSLMSIWTVRSAFHRQGQSWLGREPAELAWWRTLALRCLIAIAGVAVIKLTFQRDVGDYIIATLITLIIYSTSIHVIARSAFFVEGLGKGSPKYKKSALTPEMRDSVLERLKAMMLAEKPHLEQSLTMRELASRLKVSPHHLSQVLNEAVGCTFHEYLARHRIDEAKRLLSESERETLRIEEIAERVGYYSKSSFNTSFKRLTGMTPSGFRDSLGQDQ